MSKLAENEGTEPLSGSDKFEKYPDFNHFFVDDSRYMVLAPLELLRILIDEEDISFNQAVKIVNKSFSCDMRALDD